MFVPSELSILEGAYNGPYPTCFLDCAVDSTSSWCRDRLPDLIRCFKLHGGIGSAFFVVPV